MIRFTYVPSHIRYMLYYALHFLIVDIWLHSVDMKIMKAWRILQVSGDPQKGSTNSSLKTTINMFLKRQLEGYLVAEIFVETDVEAQIHLQEQVAYCLVF